MEGEARLHACFVAHPYAEGLHAFRRKIGDLDVSQGAQAVQLRLVDDALVRFGLQNRRPRGAPPVPGIVGVDSAGEEQERSRCAPQRGCKFSTAPGRPGVSGSAPRSVGQARRFLPGGV